jgi:preprotein translocase subunit SecG
LILNNIHSLRQAKGSRTIKCFFFKKAFLVLALFFLCAIVFGQMEAYAQTEPAKKESKAKARKRKNSKKVRKAGRRQKSDQSQYSGTISQQRTSSEFGLVDGSKKDPPRRNRKNRKARQKYFRKSNYSWAGPQSSPAGRRRYNNRSQRMSGVEAVVLGCLVEGIKSSPPPAG